MKWSHARLKRYPTPDPLDAILCLTDKPNLCATWYKLLSDFWLSCYTIVLLHQPRAKSRSHCPGERSTWQTEVMLVFTKLLSFRKGNEFYSYVDMSYCPDTSVLLFRFQIPPLETRLTGHLES